MDEQTSSSHGSRNELKEVLLSKINIFTAAAALLFFADYFFSSPLSIAILSWLGTHVHQEILYPQKQIHTMVGTFADTRHFAGFIDKCGGFLCLSFQEKVVAWEY